MMTHHEKMKELYPDKLDTEALENALVELKKLGYAKLHCIAFTVRNQGIGLKKAKTIVENSKAFLPNG